MLPAVLLTVAVAIGLGVLIAVSTGLAVFQLLGLVLFTDCLATPGVLFTDGVLLLELTTLLNPPPTQNDRLPMYV